MHLIKKKEFLDGDIHTNKYYFCGIRVLKKIWSPECRKIYLFNFLISQKLYTNNVCDINEIFAEAKQVSKQKIDIVIPIYNGYEYLPKLFDSIIKNTDLPYRILAINDHSTDKRVKTFLEKVKIKYGSKLQIINNPKNLGFVKSVNKGLKKACNHVVLLNTDVIVPKNWASRLMYPIFIDNKVASVTPFSNAATIFSIPTIFKDNTLDVPLEEINTRLSKMTNMPFKKLHFSTGVGFCMAMNKKLIEKIGVLDEIYEEGYGEENDWCQRAEKFGFYNTIAANLFVWHKHGGSFESEKKKKLIENHSKILLSRYPNYGIETQDSASNNLYLLIRFIAELFYLNILAKKTLFWFDHIWGGGAEFYTKNQFKILSKDTLCIRLQQLKTDKIKLSYVYNDYVGEYTGFSFENMFVLLSKLSKANIVVNELAGWINVENVLQKISELKKSLKCTVEYKGHDFACVCPSITLMANGEYCCVHKGCEACEKCFYENRQSFILKCEDLTQYRKKYDNFFTNVVDVITVPSKFVCNIYKTIYKHISNKIIIVPHAYEHLRKICISKHNTINIAFVGALNEHKGLRIVKEIGKIIAKYPKINLFLVGDYDKSFGQLGNIKILGKYIPKDLPNILENNNIDICVIPSVCPETFSYTLHECTSMEVPVACFNLGAQSEYLKKYKKGLVFSEINAKTVIEEIINFFNMGYKL